MLLSLVSVILLSISSILAFMNGGQQGDEQNYISPYDEDPRIFQENLNFYEAYVKTHAYHPDIYDNHGHHHQQHHGGGFHGMRHDFHHIPGFVNMGIFPGMHLPPPKSPYELCFRPIYMPVVRSNKHLVHFCVRYAKHINRAPVNPKVPLDFDQEGSGMELLP
uniref:Secreted protein n=1 Tax=Strongyloides venezuelensis TaxID=75913 RepID=A0A0K0F2R2_STRVS